MEQQGKDRSCKDCVHFYLQQGTKLLCRIHQTLDLSLACSYYKNICCDNCKNLQLNNGELSICLWGKEVGMPNYMIHDPGKDSCEMWEEKNDDSSRVN